MHLFKRLLLTKFPNSTIHNAVNPASMFIGFISAKEFFSIINRKIIENHKLNLFDVNLDPIEFKMGFGENPNSDKQKDLEIYFAYAVAANLNGTLFFSPANLANGVSLLATLYFKQAMTSFPEYYFVQLIYTVFLLSFTFVSRVKVFPSEHDQENYNWFVEVFFDFYKITFEQLQTKISDSDFFAVKKAVLQETAFCFLLFHFYKKLNSLLAEKSSDTDYLDWLLGKTKQTNLIKAFKENYATTKYLPHSSALEQSILNMVRPADILIKYLFGDANPIIAVETIVARIFDKTELDPLVQSFLTSDEQLPQLFEYLLEYKKYKYGFFAGVQNYIIKLLRSEGKEDILEDIDEMLSAIDNGDDISNFDVPERIKRESKVTERLLNFYVTLLGGFTTARGDSFYLRLLKPEILDFFTKNSLNSLLGSEVQLEYFGGVLYQYAKNLYYYSYINENIRAGKNKFSMPLKGDSSKVTTNFSVIKLYTEGMIASFFQDLNPKDTKLTIKNTQILELFKTQFGEQVSEMVKLGADKFLEAFYAPILSQIKDSKAFVRVLSSSLQENDLVNLKDALYKLDFWISFSFFKKLEALKLGKQYDDSLLLALFGSIRETFFGLALLFVYLEQKEKAASREKNEILLMVYVRDILGIKIKKADQVFKVMVETIEELKPILKLWISLDDNKGFFDLIAKNWDSFCAEKTEDQLLASFSGEDLVWFRGLLKNIAYYNKRFVMPR
ncbi:hypothetical protein BSK20_01555 [SR1 bacterium human oral taxon HOT-345]|nr:hypothetical protein BSK20_01555 [SR1 bacterium human oral taxon HOT-345]